MEAQVISEAAKNGIFSLLFVVLFIWTMRENKCREDKSDKREEAARERELEHREFIRKLQTEIACTATNNHQIVTAIADDLEVVSDKVHSVAKDVQDIQTKVIAIDKKLDIAHTKIDKYHQDSFMEG